MGLSGSLVGVLAHLFQSTGAGEDVHLDCTLMLWLASICQPDTGSAQPRGVGDCLACDAIVQCSGGTLFALIGLRSSSAIGPCGSGCILWAASMITLLDGDMGGVSMSCTACRNASWGCTQSLCMWVSVLTLGEGLSMASSQARVWSTSVASLGSRQKSGGTMQSLRSPLGWT